MSIFNNTPQSLLNVRLRGRLKPLSKVASSGELARVMLALKTILADVDEVPVLVFDEVDANVGGEIGQVGEQGQSVARIK